jgi:hypothetical protein
MIELLYFSLFLLALVLCCNAAIGAVLMIHLLRRWREDERRGIAEDAQQYTLMGSVRESWR